MDDLNLIYTIPKSTCCTASNITLSKLHTKVHTVLFPKYTVNGVWE